jgi:RNA polymerase sigma-70 factor (ECF subfamily)
MRGRAKSTTEAMPASMPDATLVARALIERHAFGFIFDRYWDAIFRFCYFRLGDWHLAEDAASQVFERALAGLERFAASDGEHNVRAWLFGIARNVLHETRRATQRQGGAVLEEAREIASSDRSVEQQAIDAEQRAQLRALFARLNDEQRELLELRLAGLSSAEIGELLGKSAGAIRTAQSRTVDTLRTFVAQEGFDHD